MSETRVRKLGKRQREVLNLIKQHGDYHKKGSWKYNSHSETIEILLSLEGKGLVKRTISDDGETSIFTFVSDPEESQPVVESEAPHVETDSSESVTSDPALNEAYAYN